MSRAVLALVASALVIAACSFTDLDQARPYRCAVDDECSGGFVCGGDRFCVDPLGDTFAAPTAAATPVTVERVSPEFVPGRLPDHVVAEDRLAPSCVPGAEVPLPVFSVTWAMDGGIRHISHYELGRGPLPCTEVRHVEQGAAVVPAGRRVLAAAPLHQEGRVLLTTTERGECVVPPGNGALALGCATGTTPVDFDRLRSEVTGETTERRTLLGWSTRSSTIGRRIDTETAWTSITLSRLDGGLLIPNDLSTLSSDDSIATAELAATSAGMYMRRRPPSAPPAASPDGWEPVAAGCERDPQPVNVHLLRKIRGTGFIPSLLYVQKAPFNRFPQTLIWGHSDQDPVGSPCATPPGPFTRGTYRTLLWHISACSELSSVEDVGASRIDPETGALAIEMHCREPQPDGPLYSSFFLKSGSQLPDPPHLRGRRRISHSDLRGTTIANDLGHVWLQRTAPADRDWGTRNSRSQAGAAPHPLVLDDAPLALFSQGREVYAFTDERLAREGPLSTPVQRAGTFVLRGGLGFAALRPRTSGLGADQPRAGVKNAPELAVLINEVTHEIAVRRPTEVVRERFLAVTAQGAPELVRGPFHGVVIHEADAVTPKFVALAAFDTVLIGTATPGRTGPATLAARAVPLTRSPITSFELLTSRPRNDPGRQYAHGYAVAGDRLFEISASSQYLWRSNEVTVPEQAVAVMVDAQGRGRVGLGDGRLLSLPDRFRLLPPLPAAAGRAVSFAEVCGNFLALAVVRDGSQGTLFRAASGPRHGEWIAVPLDEGQLPRIARDFVGARLLVNGSRAFAFLRNGFALEVKGLTCAPR